jgi:hypothetical protein
MYFCQLHVSSDLPFSEHIMYLNAIGRPIIVLHSLKAAFELLDRRVNIYSDRPRPVVANDLCGGRLIALMPYEYSQRQYFAIISRFIVRRQFSKTQATWTSTSSALSRPLPCLYYMTTPPSRTNMTKPTQGSAPSLIACRQLQLLEYLLVGLFPLDNSHPSEVVHIYIKHGLSNVS